MKVLCSACEAAEARVVCCADEAALCARCDRDVHDANRLAGKHHRLPLLSAASNPPAVSAPNCDICQEGHAYFFCVEDRALLCRSCDVAVHTANAFVSAHRRFLLTGVQVGLEPDEQEEPVPEPEPEPQPPNNASSAPLQPPMCPRKRSPTPLYSDGDIDWAAGPDVGITGNLPDWSVIDEQFGSGTPALRPAEPEVIKAPPKKSPRVAVTAASAALFGGSMPDWPLDEFFGFTEFNSGFGFAENGTSKADSGKLSSPNRRSMSSSSSGNAAQNAQDFFGQVPEVHWSRSSMPELPSPPTASGLHWQGDPHYGSASDSAAVFVPDICSPENPFRCFTAGADQQLKRRRRC
ncbi:B-box zinc finger protein 22 [Aegilops tauschii subsp. strangulata]|uniref:B box-type domain-containing protein n=2 Tax=Aegilops tauschii subsp. strangulata TaxID=200361 RepID=A0A453ECW2_AEGTS|nr:B-box zinc finger protein 22 [Aegilops tauschii subsp. strangulata]